MDKLNPFLIALVGTGGIGGFFALFVVPAQVKFKSNEKRLAALEAEVGKLKETNKFLTAGVTSLIIHSDAMRLLVLNHNPNAHLQTAEEILDGVRRNIDRLTEIENNDTCAA